MRRRSGRIAEADASAISWPAKRIEPAVGSWMRTTSRAKVDLPQPDSPTTPTVSPAATSRSTPSTARTTLLAPNRPSRGSGKCLTRPRTDKSGSAAAPSDTLAGALSLTTVTGRAPAGGGSGAPDCVTQQRALRPGAISISAGCSSHLAMRNGQRGAKRHPDGIASGSGGAPSMVVSRRVPGRCRSIRGTALISAQV